MQPSNMTYQLYGEERAGLIAERLVNISPEFNYFAQTVAYDIFWTLPGLSLLDKSLVTVASLIAMHKEEQTRIHMYGFLHAGGNPSTLISAAYLVDNLYPSEQMESMLKIITDVLHEHKIDDAHIEELFNATSVQNLSTWEQCIISLAAAVAACDKPQIKYRIQQSIDAGLLDVIKHVFTHQIVYCGFPTAMDAFTILQQTLKH